MPPWEDALARNVRLARPTKLPTLPRIRRGNDQRWRFRTPQHSAAPLLKKNVALLSETVVQVRQFAYHDELTGLPNRRLLLDRFDQAMARATRQHKLVALLLLDLDGFKTINDALGHVAGDSLLKQLAARLSVCIRTSDTACRDGNGYEDLLRQSDVAMYCDKARGLVKPS